MGLSREQSPSSLVRLLAKEIGEARQKSYGFTAEQVVEKLLKDELAIGLLSHFLGNMNEKEMGRLLVSLIPDQHYGISIVSDSERPNRSVQQRTLRRAYREIFDRVETRIRAAALSTYAALIIKESSEKIQIHEDAFFEVSDLEFAAPADVQIIIQRITSRLDNIRSPLAIQIAKRCDGIFRYTTPEGARQIAMRLLLMLTSCEDRDADPIIYAIDSVGSSGCEKCLPAVKAEVEALIERFQTFGNTPGVKKALERLKRIDYIPIPF